MRLLDVHATINKYYKFGNCVVAIHKLTKGKAKHNLEILKMTGAERGVHNAGYDGSTIDPDRRMNRMNEHSGGSQNEFSMSIPNQTNGNVTSDMRQKFQNLPPEMRQVFMSMSNKEKQKFIEFRKQAANLPEEKRKKMFQKMYQDHMKKQVRDIIKERRYFLFKIYND